MYCFKTFKITFESNVLMQLEANVQYCLSGIFIYKNTNVNVIRIKCFKMLFKSNVKNVDQMVRLELFFSTKCFHSLTSATRSARHISKLMKN